MCLEPRVLENKTPIPQVEKEGLRWDEKVIEGSMRRERGWDYRSGSQKTVPKTKVYKDRPEGTSHLVELERVLEEDFQDPPYHVDSGLVPKL